MMETDEMGSEAGWYVEYNSNNSGGRWWLSDDDWHALERAGWVVAWVTLSNVYDDAGGYVYDERGVPKLVPGEKGVNGFWPPDENGRWLGGLAKTAYRPGLSLREAADEWERITGKSATDAGCACCGQPHNFYERKDGKCIASGPSTSYEARW